MKSYWDVWRVLIGRIFPDDENSCFSKRPILSCYYRIILFPVSIIGFHVVASVKLTFRINHDAVQGEHDKHAVE